MAKFVGDELSEINSTASIYDSMILRIREAVKNPLTFTKFLKLFKDFTSKNETKLNTNIIGRQIILNSKVESDVMELFGFEKSEIKKIIADSPYFKKFGKELLLIDQLCFAVPLIFASLEYRRLNKNEESSLCYFFIFFKPYSSRESLFFKYGVNEGQMLYTIENDLTDRFDIKKYKTIFLSIKKQSESSYNNYITEYGANDKITDKDLHIIYNSGIATRMNHFIGGVVEKYRKNSGKSLEFENAVHSIYDKDSDSNEYEQFDIASDAYVKNNVVNKVLNRITKDPVDKKLVLIACQSVYGSSANFYTDIFQSMIEEITSKMFTELPKFFNALISSFLFHDNPNNNKKYTMTDFKSTVFLNVGSDILAGKKSHLKDTNMVTAREIFGRMLENYSEEYRAFGETYKRNMRKALANYWVYLVKTSS